MKIVFFLVRIRSFPGTLVSDVDRIDTRAYLEQSFLSSVRLPPSPSGVNIF